MAPATEALPPQWARLRPLAWEGFAFTLPPYWEITGHALRYAQHGRLQLHRRTEPMGELGWRQARGTPDFPRQFADVLRRAQEPGVAQGAPSLRVTTRQVGEWTLAWDAPNGPLLAGLWQAGQGRVLEWVFPGWTPERLDEEIVPLLQSFTGNHGPTRRWRLFGVGCTLPEAFASDGIQAYPGAVRLSFATARGHWLSVRRLGLVPELVAAAGGLAPCIGRLVRQDGHRLLGVTTTEHQGMPAVAVRFERRPQRGMEQLVGRWWPGEGLFWHDAEEGRIYGFAQAVPPRATPVDLLHAWA